MSINYSIAISCTYNLLNTHDLTILFFHDVVIRTNTFETILTINGPQDTVSHFSYAASVVVEHIKASSYDEYGTVGRVEVKDGHVEAMDGCEVFCLMEEGESVTPTTVNTGATVHPNMVNINAAENVEKDSTTGVANGHVDDCGPGRHTFSQYVVDTEHVYDVCTCCGYTLIHVMDESGTEIKQTKNTLDSSGDVTKENVTPVETYLTTEHIPTKVVEGNKVVDTENLQVENYNISGNDGEPIEETPVVVNKDEEGKDIIIERNCKHEFNYTDYLHDTDDICLGTCKYCGLKIHTKHDWWVKTQLPGQTTYAAICIKCGCTRETNVAMVVDKDGKAINYGKYADETDVTNGKYQTVSAAFAAIHAKAAEAGATPQNKYKATITLLNDDNLDVYYHALTVDYNEDITLELNGKVILGYLSNTKDNSSIITNRGTLTISDSSDTNKDGTGTGRITAKSTVPDLLPVPGYATNNIRNCGTLTILSGCYENLTEDGASYAVDVDNRDDPKDKVLTIKGGKFTASYAQAIRGYLLTSVGCDISIENAYVSSVWLQDYSSSGEKGSLIINNSMLESVEIGYLDNAENVYCKITNSTIKNEFLYTLSYSGTNNYLYLENNNISGFYMPESGKVLGPNTFVIEPGSEVALGWQYVNESDTYKKWYGDAAYASKGIRIDYDDNYPGTRYYAGYLNETGLKLGIKSHVIDGYVFKENGNNTFTIGIAKYQLVATYTVEGTIGSYSSEELAQTAKTSLEESYSTLTGEILSSKYVLYYWNTTDTAKVYIDSYYDTEEEALAEKSNFDSLYDNSTYNIKSTVEGGKYVLIYEGTLDSVYGNYLTYDDAQAEMEECAAYYGEDFVSAKVVEIE